MTPRVRLMVWALGVLGTLASPVLFRMVAPWAGAAWQCVCLAAIAVLYATTPASAIRLPPHVSRGLILLHMALIPALCFGRVTAPLVLSPLLALAFDHVRIARETPFRVTLRRDPGPLADWLTTVALWSPAMWVVLAGPHAAAHPAIATLAGAPIILVVLVSVQTSVLTRERPWPRRTLMVAGGLILAALVVMVFGMEAS